MGEGERRSEGENARGGEG
jgi:hypothetical protein